MTENLDSRIERLKSVVSDFPLEPGVYIMKNVGEKIIYVGKAKSLKPRVRSYLGKSKDLTPKTRLLVSHIQTIDYILTKTEVEAFLLEASLIKKHRPKYNIRLKDDRAYPYIRVSMKDDFPRFYLSRRVLKDGSAYFGPFTSSFVVRETMRVLNRLFQIRDCSDHFMKGRKRPCMTHQIGRCSAPCVDLVEKEKYAGDIKQCLLFLKGRDKKLLKELEKQMMNEAEKEHFEVAARLRDGLQALRRVLQKQTVVNDSSEIDQDVIGIHCDERGTNLETLHIRQGRVVGSRPHFTTQFNAADPEEDARDWLTSFVNLYYEENIIPDEVILPISVGHDLTKLLEAVLEERKGSPVRVRLGTERGLQQLLELCEKNAREHFKAQVERSDKKRRGLEMIQKKFKLPVLPFRIECFDNSHFQGKETVASQVVFEEGVPMKEQYRLYRLKEASGGDDYAAMKEVLSRRLKHLEYDDPQLILVDGGKGQLNIAVKVLKDLGRTDLFVASLAKARTKGEFDDQEVKSTEERFYLPGRANPVVFSQNSEAFRILVNARDEAHRFAINYHRKLRENSSLSGALDFVEGLGEKRKKTLLQHFDSVEEIKAASVEEIAILPGLNKKVAEAILADLQVAEEEIPTEK